MQTSSTNAYMLMYRLCGDLNDVELVDIPEDVMQEVQTVEQKVVQEALAPKQNKMSLKIILNDE